MPATQLSDEDVIALVRKEFERKLSDFCAEHGYDDPGAASEEDPNESGDDSEEGDEEHDDKAGDRSEEKPKKPERIKAKDLATGTRVKHLDSKLTYTVTAIDLGGNITLRIDDAPVNGSEWWKPDGDGGSNQMTLPWEEFEEEYGLD